MRIVRLLVDTEVNFEMRKAGEIIKVPDALGTELVANGLAEFII